MVYHRCILCIDEPVKKVTMLTRKKSCAAMSSPRVCRRKAESTEISKNKKITVQNDVIEPTRRSNRGKRNVPINVPSPQIQRNGKRNAETVFSSNGKKSKALRKSHDENEGTYCWMCHKLGHGQTCACTRVYHDECLEKASQLFENNKCPECQLETVNGTEQTRPFVEGLKIYLESATKLIAGNHKNKMLSWPQNRNIVPAMDFETLLTKVQADFYKTTGQFYSDVKWFYHNYCIQYGEHSKQSKHMKTIIGELKKELFDIEACPECYYHLYSLNLKDSETAENLNDENFFVRLCNPPHDIVWAKVTGHSHWPAKCLKVINGKAHVRFFGKHEKADIPINTIFRISLAHPLYEYRNITEITNRTSLEYTYAKNELLKYIELYEEKVGKFPLSKFRVFYEPGNDSSIAQATEQPGYCAVPGTSPLSIISSTGEVIPCETTISNSSNDMSVNMTFCVDAPENSSSIPRYRNALFPDTHFQQMKNAANLNTPADNRILRAAVLNTLSESMSPISSTSSRTNDSEIKKEIYEFGEGETSNGIQSDLMQVFRNPFMNHSNFSGTGGSFPNVSIVKEENYECVPSTSEADQPEKQINTSASTTEVQQSPEFDVISLPSNNAEIVIDLTEDDDNDNSFPENAQMQNLLHQAHQVVDTLMSHLCEEMRKKQARGPSQMVKDLTKKLNETQKNFQEQTEKLRDEIKCLQMRLEPEE